jgi:hypothetical protein
MSFGIDGFGIAKSYFNVMKANTINEYTAGSGVTVDGVLLKDGGGAFTGAVTMSNNTAATVGLSVSKTGDTTGNVVLIENSGESRSLEIMHNFNNGGTVDDIIRIRANGDPGTLLHKWDKNGNYIISVGDLIVTTATTPASSGAGGTVGTIGWDTSYVYVCVAANTWKRALIETW